MNVGELCVRDVITVFEDDSIHQAAQLMRRYHCGSVIVVRQAAVGNIPVGIVTDRDLVIEIIALQVPIEAVCARDVMSANLILARESDELWDTLQRMRQHGVRRIPVVDERQCLAGILSLDDVIEFLAEELAAVSRIFSVEVSHEQHDHETV